MQSLSLALVVCAAALLVACDSADRLPDSGGADTADADTATDTDSAVDTDTAADTDTAPPADDDGDGWPVPDDCDDGRPEVFPGAAEACDRRDNDCDGSIDEPCWPSVLTDADAAVTFTGAAGDVAATQVEGGADLTGDGQVDLVVSGAWWGGAGRVWVIPGPLVRGTTLPLADASVAALDGPDTFGWRVSADGDLDGDGVDDLAVRTYEGGAVDVYYGGASWAARAADLSFTTADLNTDLLVADLDGSGRADLVTACADDIVCIRRDPTAGGDLASGAIAVSGFGSGYFGMGVTDFDADGDGAPGLALGTYAGTVSLGIVAVFGDAPAASVSAFDADWILGAAPSEGTEFAQGDFDGDGYDDLLVNRAQEAVSGGFLIPGPFSSAWTGVVDPATVAVTTLEGPQYTGSGLCARDLDQDGALDLLLGRHAGESSWVEFGPLPSGTLEVEATADITVTTAAHVSDQHFQDCTGELVPGYVEGFAVGAAFDATAGADAGAVFVFLPG